MDLVSTRTIDITKLAMDGLMQRQKAIMSNTANVMTPGYQRQDVSFESQLKEIVEKDDLKKMLKTQNSMQYNPSSLDLAMGDNSKTSLTLQQTKFLQSNIYGNYNPQFTTDTASGADETGNNVNLEKEVMDMASVGMKYNVLATLESKKFRDLATVIKGESQ